MARQGRGGRLWDRGFWVLYRRNHEYLGPHGCGSGHGAICPAIWATRVLRPHRPSFFFPYLYNIRIAFKSIDDGRFGVFIGTIGTDFITGGPRFVYGIHTFRDGIGIVPVVMGLFGIAEVLENLEGLLQRTHIIKTKFIDLFPTLQDWKESIPAILRGGFIGFFLGLLPGGGSIMASFVSYAAEREFLSIRNDLERCDSRCCRPGVCK